MTRTRTIRDPLWGNIRVGPDAAPILDTPQFQRLRGVKQLGLAHLVYPGAVHTRFLHALGVYHLTSLAVETLARNGGLERLDRAEREAIPLVRLAALLHDIGHYPFSHAMEEVGPESIPGHHEEVASRFLRAEPIRRALEPMGADAEGRIGELIRGASDHPLQGLVAGSLDLDKIDYLRRDGLFCGVPYGAVDVDRLLDALTLARETEAGGLELAVTEKGISALETLLFSKYQMFRNVYWHHAVRASTSAFRRLIEAALASGLLHPDELAGPTDEELLALLGQRLERPEGARGAGASHDRAAALLHAITRRRLPKRALELMGDSLPDGVSSWVADRPDLVRRVEDRLADEWGLAPGTVMLDYPGYPEMLELRLLLVRRDGAVQRLTSRGERGLIDLPRLSRSLHHAARVFRVFTLERGEPRDATPLLELIEASAGEVEARLEETRALYA
ncbi:MAG: HD domain-containing protein [Gemmatimonadota bacterium]